MTVCMQATATQQAEMKKIKAMQDKLGAELTALSKKMNELQVSKADGGAQCQVIIFAPTSCSCLLLLAFHVLYKATSVC